VHSVFAVLGTGVGSAAILTWNSEPIGIVLVNSACSTIDGAPMPLSARGEVSRETFPEAVAEVTFRWAWRAFNSGPLIAAGQQRIVPEC